MSREDDAPPVAAVEAMALAWCRDNLSCGCKDVWACAEVELSQGMTKISLAAARALPPAARWRLIGWLAQGLEPTRGMRDALLRRMVLTSDAGTPLDMAGPLVLSAALAAAREAGDA